MTNNKEVITGNDFKRMIAGAYGAFGRACDNINDLNVFPVPDGDTGTNMFRTLGAVATAVAEAKEEGIGSLAKRAADSAIMGARGNSGVILSQIFRGLGRGLAGKHEADSSELGKAFQYGILYAYRSVTKPVEGTILTVAKAIAKGAYHAVRSNLTIAEILEAAIAAGEAELQRTPELLPALKAAGVVDAGGKGLIVFLNGCLEGLGGNLVPTEVSFEMRYKSARIAPETEIDIARPYCTEFLIKNTKVKTSEVRATLAEMGDSLIVAEGFEAIKVHIHTGHPGAVLEQAVGWGTLHDIKIDNMADQSQSRAALAPPKPLLKTAVISVAAGDGLERIMTDLGAAITIPGGQSMNPSVEEFIDAAHRQAAEKYFILPNNRNIMLAAAQVKKLLGDAVEIIPAASTPQGLAALVAYDASLGAEENAAKMNQAIQNIKEACVTKAVRDSVVDGVLVKEGAYIGVIDGKVKLCCDTLDAVLRRTIEEIAEIGSEIVTLYYGRDLTSGEASALSKRLIEELPGLKVEIYEGGQPHYHFIISVE